MGIGRLTKGVLSFMGAALLAGCPYGPVTEIREPGFQRLIGLEALSDGSLIAANTRHVGDDVPTQLSITRLTASYGEIWHQQYDGFVGAGGRSLAIASDDGIFLCAGSTLLKIDADGGELWRKLLDDESVSVIAGISGDIFLISRSQLRKLDSDGELLWSRDDLGTLDFRIGTGAPTGDGGLVVAGPVYSGRHLFIELDGNGEVVWETTIERRDVDPGNSIRLDLCTHAITIAPNRDIVSIGNSDCGTIDGGETGFVMRLNPQGELVWFREDQEENLYRYSDIENDGEGGFLIAAKPTRRILGSFWYRLRRQNLRLMSIDSAGNETMRHTFSPTLSTTYHSAWLASRLDGNLTLGTTANATDLDSEIRTQGRGILLTVGPQGDPVTQP